MADEKVILSEEPSSVRINIEDPNKPNKKQIATAKKLPPKETVVDKVIHGFYGNDVNRTNVGDYILKERLIPVGQRMLNNASQNFLKRTGDAIQMLIFGKVIQNNNGPTDYTSFSNPNVAQAAPPTAHKLMNQVEQFAFSTRNDAERVLAYLRGRIKEFGSCSVLDYYEAVNEPVDYMMSNQGWMDLSTAQIRVAPEGFIIDLPRPIALKRG